MYKILSKKLILKCQLCVTNTDQVIKHILPYYDNDTYTTSLQ